MTTKIEMKKKTLIFILAMLSIISFAQKKEIYLDEDSIQREDLIEISKNKFDITVKGYIYFNFQFDLDSLILNVKVQRIKKGQIPNKSLDSIKSELLIISGKTIPDGNVIVINYYHGLDRCHSSGNKSYISSGHKRFSKKINEIENVSQFSMYKSSKGIKKYGNKSYWIKDEFGTIQKMFLPLHYPCGSYVLIDENGNYYIQKGEYAFKEIFDLLKNKKTTFTNNTN